MALLFNVEELKKQLLAFTQTELLAYCQSKPELKNIYAIGYDFDTCENVVYLSLNTLADHQKTLEDYGKLSYMQASIATDEGLREVKYHPGNWRHVAFAEFKPLQASEHDTWQGFLGGEAESESTKIWYENFHALVDAITESLICAAQTATMKQLPIVEPLYFIAIDHDESFPEAEQRMQRIMTTH